MARMGRRLKSMVDSRDKLVLSNLSTGVGPPMEEIATTLLAGTTESLASEPPHTRHTAPPTHGLPEQFFAPRDFEWNKQGSGTVTPNSTTMRNSVLVARITKCVSYEPPL